VVTRHPALLDFLIEEGIVQEGNFLLIAQAKAEDVEGKDVIGNLPLHLAAMAHTITEVPLKIPFELRGKELTLDQIRKYAGDPVTYNVERSTGRRHSPSDHQTKIGATPAELNAAWKRHYERESALREK